MDTVAQLDGHVDQQESEFYPPIPSNTNQPPSAAWFPSLKLPSSTWVHTSLTQGWYTCGGTNKSLRALRLHLGGQGNYHQLLVNTNTPWTTAAIQEVSNMTGTWILVDSLCYHYVKGNPIYEEL